MNGGDTALASRVAQLQRRARALSILVAVVGCLAIASAALGAWCAYGARETRKDETFSKRKIEHLEATLSAHTARADRQLLVLERQMQTTRLQVRRGELTAVRRWLTRADQALSGNRVRIEGLERRLEALEDSLRGPSGE